MFLRDLPVSEDLDFMLRNKAHLDETFLKRVFAKVGAWVYDETGIEIPADQQEFDIYPNPRGNLSCQGKISYKGPVSPTRPLPRINIPIHGNNNITNLSAPSITRIWWRSHLCLPMHSLPEALRTQDLRRYAAAS
jgi:hypothetical protein